MSAKELEKIFTNPNVSVHICLENNSITDDNLLKKLGHFISNTILSETSKHKMGFVFHTGSICYDTVLFVYAYLSALLKNDYSADEMINSLTIGDMVLYNESTRCRFMGFENAAVLGLEEGNMIILEQDDKCHTKHYVPEKNWSKIQKYSGTSKRTDSRGIKRISSSEKTNRKLLAEVIFGTDDETVFLNTTTSIIVCMTRDKAEYLYKNISFCVKDKKSEFNIKLKDIATASYYTENDEYPLGKNPAKNEPIIQIASDLSVARELQRRRTENTKTGIVICGDEPIMRAEDDLDDVIISKRTDFAIMSVSLSSKYISHILKEYEDKRFFNCTRDFLLTHCDFGNEHTNPVLYGLHKEIDTFIDCEVQTVELNGFYDWQLCAELKRNIHFIASDSYESEDKEQFVMYAFSVLNLFLRSAFTLEDMERLIDYKQLDVVKVEQRIEDLRKWSEGFPSNIKSISNFIVDNFELFYLYALDKCEKKDYLINFISKNHDSNIAIVVDRKYYADIMIESEIVQIQGSHGKVTISTAAGFDNEQLYDYVITVGCIEGKYFNPLNCYNAKYVMILTYPFEKKLINVKIKQHRKFINTLNSVSTLPVDTDEPVEELFNNQDEENNAIEVESVDKETIDLVESLRRKYIAREFNFTGHYETNSYAVAVRNAKLDTGEVVFFSKNYKAYVYNESKKTVSEVSVEKLSEGDTIVFSSSDSDTMDIVELIMSRRLAEHRYSSEEEEFISMSKYWKNVLRNYKKNNELTYEELYQQLKKQGLSVEKQAVICWIDEDSHIVSPRKIDSLHVIAILCDDHKLFDNASAYFESCREVKRIRRKILQEIGTAIRNKVCGISPSVDDEMYDIYQKLDNQIKVSAIEFLVDEEREVPINKINKPL